jgi:sortase A
MILRILLAGIIFLFGLKQVQADPAQQPTLSYIWIQDPYTSESVLTRIPEPDTSLWNAARIEDYEESLKADIAPPLGILTIDKLNIRVPVYNGTEELILNRGAGRIKGMARMDGDGNLGISAHRDGFFRGLKDIGAGDQILLETTRGVQEYAVSAINVVPKSDVSVLKPATEKTLTLVTCYPFYFVGNAPERYIVTALPTRPGSGPD